MTNPLLGAPGRLALPTFADIRPEHVSPALDQLLAEAETALQHATSDAVPAEYNTLSAVLDVAVERLQHAWSVVTHLQAVADTPAMRAAFSANLARVTAFYTRLGADARLYHKYRSIAASPQAATLPAEQRKALADALRDFVLGGAELQGAARERFAAIQDRLAALAQQFGEHVLDATDAFVLYVDASRLAGVPADIVAATREAAAADPQAGQAGHKLTLQAPVLMPLLAYADDRSLREQLFRANATRASEFGPAELDNTALMREMVELRQEEAALLGQPSYAALSLVAKMAETPAQVQTFVCDLAQRARPFAERERDELQAFAARELGLPELQAWDRRWASEKLRQARFDYSADELKQYFTEPRVLQGLFELVQTLFGIQIQAAAASVWHPSVRYFEITRAGQPIAGFYLDLHARVGKQAGAWMDDVHQRWLRPDGAGLQLPVAHLVCNFAPPLGALPSLLTHDDVITLFHEFGHGLHHMLTRVDERAVAGIAGVEWDAVELPSQFMENFCWEWPVLSRLCCHVTSGQALPRALFDKLLASRSFQRGLQMQRQCEYALFDMRLHAEAGAAARVQALADEVQAQVCTLPAPAFMRYPHTFSHIFDGSYAAGMYSYAWAEVLSADAFSAFEESGLFDAGTGQRYLQSILEVGGSREALQSFVAFRGRAPRIDALLRHQGLA